MKLYWIKTNRIIKKLFSHYVWDLPNTKQTIYLTFDDGPTAEITSWVLEELKRFKAKATFFCIGNNIEKYPEIFEQIIQKGHTIGNHTFDHYNGWSTKTSMYVENAKKWELLDNTTGKNSLLFRPPYGKIKLSQSKLLRKLGYKIIMWDVLSADFDSNISPEQCLKNVIENTKTGSIVVFHDSVKAFPNLEYVLPKALEIWTSKGYNFEAIQ